MGKVFLNPMGDGFAYTFPAAGTELANGEEFEVYAQPYAGATLDDIRAFDSYDHPVAIPVAEHFTMTFRSAWNNLYIDFYFSNSPTPPAPSFPYWLLGAIHRRKKRHNI